MFVRPLPLLLLVSSVFAQNITITSSSTGARTVLPQALIIQGSGQQSITFTNNSASAVDIRFAPNPVYPSAVVFNDIVGLSPNNTNTQMPQVANGSVNYHVVVGSTQYGPYAIQVGQGPMYVQLSYDSATGQILTIPHMPLIPPGGTMEMVSADFTYSISWSGTGDPFTPVLTSIGVGVSNNAPHQVTTTDGDYAYQLTLPGSNTGNGGCKVIVKGS